MAITVLLDLDIKPERQEEFFEVLRGALVDTRKRQGFQSITVHKDQDKPGHTLFWERWDTRADHESYMAWRMETGFMDAVGPFVNSEPAMSYLDDVDA